MSLMENMVGGGGAPVEGQPAPTGEPAPTNGSAAPAPFFYDLPDEYKDNEGIKKFVKDGKVDGSAVLKSYTHLESMNGRDKIVIPKTPEERIAARRQMGAPDAPEKYTVTRPEMPEGMAYDEDGEKFMRQFGVENGWDQADFDAAYKTYFERQQNAIVNWQKMDKAAAADCEASLRKEHGQAYDGFYQAGSTALQEYADPDFLTFLQSKGLANDPRMIRVFGRIGMEMKGDTKLKGGGSGAGSMTPEEVDAKITAFRAEHHEALFNGEHVDHKARVAELSRLHAMKTGGK